MGNLDSPISIFLEGMKEASGSVDLISSALRNKEDCNRAERLNVACDQTLQRALQPYRAILTQFTLAIPKDKEILHVLNLYDQKWKCLIADLNQVTRCDASIDALSIAQQNAHEIFQRRLFDPGLPFDEDCFNSLAQALSNARAALQDAIRNQTDRPLTLGDKVEITKSIDKNAKAIVNQGRKIDATRKSGEWFRKGIAQLLHNNNGMSIDESNEIVGLTEKYIGLENIPNETHRAQIRAAIDYSHGGFAIYPPALKKHPTITDLARKVWELNVEKWKLSPDSFASDKDYSSALLSHYKKYPKAFLCFDA